MAEPKPPNQLNPNGRHGRWHGWRSMTPIRVELDRAARILVRLPATLRRVRPFLLVAAATLAIVDVTAIILLVSGVRRRVFVGFRMIRPHDVVGAAQVAAVLCGIVMVLGWHRRGIRYAALVTLIGMALLTMEIAAGSPRRTFPRGDGALIESYTLMATQRKLVVGPYSRYGWHHPGPLYFWLAAPFYALAKFKSSGIHVAVQCINASSVLIAAWIAARFASPALIAAFFVAMVGYLWRAREMFVSLWNPHVPILPTIALTFVCAAIACGEVALLPLAAFLASFVAQTYIGLVPCAAGLCVIAIVSAVVKSRLERGVWIDAGTRRAVNLTAWLLVLLWSGPIADQIVNSPGNLTQTIRFFGESHARPPVGDAFAAWAVNVTGTLLPNFRFDGGGGLVPGRESWPLVAAMLQLILLAPTILLFKAKGHRFNAAFAGVVLVALIIALWSVTRIVGIIPAYGIVWITAIGLLATATLCAAGIELFTGRLTGLRRPSWATTVICSIFLLAYGTILWQVPTRGPESLSREESQVSTLSDSLRDYCERTGTRRPLLRIGENMWAITAGLGLQLQLANRDFAVERGAVFLFTNEFAANGTEDAVITVAPPSLHRELVARPDNVVVASVDSVYLDAVRIPPYSDR